VKKCQFLTSELWHSHQSYNDVNWQKVQEIRAAHERSDLEREVNGYVIYFE
jgi:hypothetical protein